MKHHTVEEARAAGLEHPGCRHRYGVWIEGISQKPEPQGKPEDYEQRTQQRSLERQVRAWKRREAAGDPKASAYVKKWQKELRDHVEEHGLKRRYDREKPLVGKVGTARPKPASKPGLDLPKGPHHAPKIPKGGIELEDQVRKVHKLMEDTHWMPEVVYTEVDEVNTASWDVLKKTVKVGTKLDHPLNTIAHEHGHMLELGHLGRSKVPTNALKSVKTNTAIQIDPEWVAWEDAVKETKLYKRLVEKKDTYRLRLDELWARSYAQWLAGKTKDPAMLAELKRMQVDDGLSSFSGIDWRDQVWDDDDFKEVWDAVDHVMTLVGEKNRKWPVEKTKKLP